MIPPKCPKKIRFGNCKKSCPEYSKKKYKFQPIDVFKSWCFQTTVFAVKCSFPKKVGSSMLPFFFIFSVSKWHHASGFFQGEISMEIWMEFVPQNSGVPLWKTWLSLRIFGMSWDIKTYLFWGPRGVMKGGSGVSIGGVKIVRVGRGSNIPSQWDDPPSRSRSTCPQNRQVELG